MCLTCDKKVTKYNHFCHMPQYESEVTEGDNILRVFFDLETRQDSLLSETEPEKVRNSTEDPHHL